MVNSLTGASSAPQTTRRRRIAVHESVQTISGWPTDTISVDYMQCSDGDADSSSQEGKDAPYSRCHPNTVLMFVPGNPGCVGWYTKMLVKIVERLGDSYAARGVSYAGHGIGEDRVGRESCDDFDRDNRITHTVDGQVEHKVEWVDSVLDEMRRMQGSIQTLPKLIFLTHSIGAHLVQRICVLRQDILRNTSLLIHLMPFIRFDPPASKKALLSTVARSPDAAIAALQTASRFAATLPKEWLDVYLNRVVGVHDEEGRELALNLVRQPRFARNFLELGLEEIREVPERHDDAAMRIIGKQCPTAVLFCGGPDQWAPHFHIQDLEKLRKRGMLPNNIRTEYIDCLVHDFVVHPEMIDPVIDFCVRATKKENSDPILSRL